MNQSPNVRAKTMTLRRKHRGKSTGPWILQWILSCEIKRIHNKRKNRQTVLYQN